MRSVSLLAGRPTAAPRPTGRTLRERGAGLVEFAFVALLLFTLVGGTFDYGMAWRSGIGATEGVRTAARIGSNGGKDRATDFNALSGMKSALTASGLVDGVERVVIFRTDNIDGEIPTACKTTATSACQVITGTAFRTNWESLAMTSATQTNGCLNVATYRNWCPTTRNNTQATSEYFGVWVRIRHDYLFPIIGDGVTIERTAVMRLEPEVE
ncbi:MAG: pilus assembly protein [Actinobacteria bacterium]|nr:pilus assembly protein [Actinomycetota bacterium]